MGTNIRIDHALKMLADYVTERTNNENGMLDFLKKHEDCFKRNA